jgi:hypothetical protein
MNVALNCQKIAHQINRLNTIYLIIFFIAIFSLDLFSFPNNIVRGGDSSEYYNNTFRMLLGDKPYRDFWLLFPPGEVYLPFTIFKLLGFQIEFVQIFLKLLSICGGILGYLIAREYCQNLIGVLVAILTYSSIAYEGRMLSYAGVVYVIFLLIGCLLIINYFKKRNNLILLATGISIGCSFLFRFELASAFLLACFCTLGLQLITNNKKISQVLIEYLILITGFLTVLIAAFIVASILGIDKYMFPAIFLEGVKHGTSMNLPYFFSVGRPRISLFFLSSYISYLLPFILWLITIYLVVMRKINNYDILICSLFMFWSIFAFPKALGRSDIRHLVHTLYPCYFLLGFYLDKFSKIRQINFKKSIRLFLICITIPLLISSINKLLPDNSGFGVSSYFEVVTPNGKVAVPNSNQAQLLNNIISTINLYSNKEDYIFVTPWELPPLYALTGRRNPTYYDSLIDVIVRPSVAKQTNICNSLKSKKPKLIIHYKNINVPIFDNKKEFAFSAAAPLLQKCIEENYSVFKSYNDYLIYTLNNEKIEPIN